MPQINEYRCTICSFEMPRGSGGYMYVQAPICAQCDTLLQEDGEYCDGCDSLIETVGTNGYERVQCPHPAEYQTVANVLGPDASEKVVEQRTGQNSYCVCLSCLSQFELDLERDKRQCPECGGADVKSEKELIDEPCPKCPKGTFVEIDTGVMS